MKKLVFSLFLFTRILSGQEFLISYNFADYMTTNQHTANIYFLDFFLGGYYVADLRARTVEPSKFNCLPVFSYTTNKMIYRENDTLHLIDGDRNTHRVIKITDSLDYNEDANIFSPNGEFCILRSYIYSFRENSIKHIEYDSYPWKIKWSTDSTFLASYQTSGGDILIEHSAMSSNKDTILEFDSTFLHSSCTWDYDIARKKLYYSTLQKGIIARYISKLHMLDWTAHTDTVIFEYPKNYDTTCTIYYAGASIPDIQFSGNYKKVAFQLDWALDALSTNIYVYWPDSNKITMATNGCFHYGVKNRNYWANEDTLVFASITTHSICGLRVPGLTAVEKEDGLQQPSGYGLTNYPNPFNGSTVIECRIPQHESGELQIYNLLGKKIMTFGQENLQPGNNKISWDGKDQYGKTVSSGVYFAVLRTRDSSTKLKPLKLLYMK